MARNDLYDATAWFNVWKDATARFWTGLHETAFRASNGLLFNRIGGMPVVMLTTTGRKSGRPRTTMLTSPVQDGDRLVLVASYGGDDRHPTWFLNLRADPRVDVLMDGRTRRMRARVATPEEKAALWPRVTAAYWGYAQYQRQTARDIPLVILEPEPAQG
jgi:deazaflavin-dependent oxidoreductase (nitroreductase family)